MMESHDVLFYASAASGLGWRVPGFCFVYPSKDMAEAAFETATTSVREGRMPPTYISLSSRGSNPWSLEFTALGAARVLKTEQEGIPDGEIQEFLSLLARVAYFFVVFGWVERDGTVSLLEPAENCLFKGSLQVDSKTVVGKVVDKPPWSRLFDEATTLQIGSFLQRPS